MSERDDVELQLVLVTIMLAVIALCVFIAYGNSQTRDLQRRVGQLEQERR